VTALNDVTQRRGAEMSVRNRQRKEKLTNDAQRDLLFQTHGFHCDLLFLSVTLSPPTASLTTEIKTYQDFIQI
jgi:hypothetical protein